MKSFTYTLHGLGQTLAYLFDHFNADPYPLPSNRELCEFVQANLNVFDTDKLTNLRSWCKTSSVDNLDALEAEMEKWVASSNRRTTIKPSTGAALLFATVYEFDQAWKIKLGEQDDLTRYKCFGVKGFYDEATKTASVLTKSGDELRFWYTKTKSGLSLYDEAIRTTCGRDHDRHEIILPFVKLRDAASYNLDGWELTDLTRIESCSYENLFHLDELGAKAKSITRTMTKTKSLPQPPKRIVFDKPFAAAVYEKGTRLPAMVVYCDKDCWLKKTGA
jgi:hypothetical protein